MKFQEFPKSPKNPNHFIAKCFLALKTDPSLREANDFLVRVGTRGQVALFLCAYGYFWLTKDRQTSGVFFVSKEEAMRTPIFAKEEKKRYNK